MRKLIALLILIPVFTPLLLAQIDTSQIIYGWKLDDFYATKIPEKIDTNLAGFQNENSIYKHFLSVTTLGNINSPSISNLFTDRDITDDFTLVNAFYPFMKRITNTTYMNTHKPFTKLTYINGGSPVSKEESLDVFHTRNITPALNFGLHFTTLGSLGQYSFQRIKNNSFSIFSSRNGKVYSYHANFNFNRITADENGGVLHDSLITDTTYLRKKYIPTLFGGTEQSNQHKPDVYHEIRNISFFTLQEIAFRKLFGSPDSTENTRKIKLFYPKLAYIFSLDRSGVLYIDKNPTVGLYAGLYPDIYVNREQTADSLFYWRLQNTFRLQFQGRKNNHYFVDMTHEIMNYTQFVPSDTIIQYRFMYRDYKLPAASRQAQLFNTHLSSGFGKIFANTVKLNLYGRYYLSGYQLGDYQLSGDIELMFHGKNNTFSFKAGASNEFLKPGFLYAKFISNHFIWDQSLKQTNISHLSCDISLSSKRFGVESDYYLLHNLIYFDTAAFPRQFQRGLSVLSVVAEKEFTLWKLHSKNKLAFQQVSEPSILSLPALALQSSNYLEYEINFKATEGKLLTMIGFDLFYNTSYYANAYMPPLAVFYQQQKKYLGNYPYVDVFLNVNLKRVRFFIKYEHLNSGWLEKNFFTALHYPKNQQYMKLGISWTFYD
jgi:hypothetical protein